MEGKQRQQTQFYCKQSCRHRHVYTFCICNSGRHVCPAFRLWLRLKGACLRQKIVLSTAKAYRVAHVFRLVALSRVSTLFYMLLAKNCVLAGIKVRWTNWKRLLWKHKAFFILVPYVRKSNIATLGMALSLYSLVSNCSIIELYSLELATFDFCCCFCSLHNLVEFNDIRGVTLLRNLSFDLDFNKTKHWCWALVNWSRRNYL